MRRILSYQPLSLSVNADEELLKIADIGFLRQGVKVVPR
jgi:hypothetical protein